MRDLPEDLWIDANGVPTERVRLGDQMAVIHYDTIPEKDLTVVRGIPCTTALRTVIDVAPELRRRLRLAAAKRDLTLRQYVLDAIEERLEEDLGASGGEEAALSEKNDPVLAELWRNRRDARYDDL